MPRGVGNRLPASVKKLRGTFRKGREKRPAPAQKASAPLPPSSRPYSAQMRRILSELEPEMEAASVTNHPTFPTAKWLLAKAISEVENMDSEDAATARMRLIQTTTSLLTAFGLTPASHAQAGAGAAGKGEDQPRVPVRGRGAIPAIQ